MKAQLKKDYIKLNKLAYNRAAKEFLGKIELRKESDNKLVKRLAAYFEQDKKAKNLLELGPGSGYISKLFCERGHMVTAIEFSKEMAKVAAHTAPSAKIIEAEFLSYDFNKQKFDVLLAIAFIHLFPEKDSRALVKKAHRLLKANGMAIFSTTLHDNTSENFAQKHNFSSTPMRFRRQFDKNTFLNMFSPTDWGIIDYFTNPDSEKIHGKTWQTVILMKKTSG